MTIRMKKIWERIRTSDFIERGIIIICVIFGALLILFFRSSQNGKQIFSYLLGVTSLALIQLSHHWLVDKKEQEKDKQLEINLKNSICQEINFLKEHYLAPIKKILAETETDFLELIEKPVLTKYPVPHDLLAIYNSNIKDISFLESEIKEKIISCYGMLKEFIFVLIEYNKIYDIFTDKCHEHGINPDDDSTFLLLETEVDENGKFLTDSPDLSSYIEPWQKRKKLFHHKKLLKNTIEKTDRAISQLIKNCHPKERTK